MNPITYCHQCENMVYKSPWVDSLEHQFEQHLLDDLLLTTAPPVQIEHKRPAPPEVWRTRAWHHEYYIEASRQQLNRAYVVEYRFSFRLSSGSNGITVMRAFSTVYTAMAEWIPRLLQCRPENVAL